MSKSVAYLAVLLTCLFSSATAEARRPNVILLESDDHHFQALGCMGDPVQTPNIDKLAARGVLFRNNVCQGTACSPSRNALLAGAYPHNTGIYYNKDGNLPDGIWTFPQALLRTGYHTALVGKNHFKPYSTVSMRDRTAAMAADEMRSLGFEYLFSTTGKVAAATAKDEVGEDPYRQYLASKGLLDKLTDDYKSRRGIADLTDLRPSVLSVDDYHDTYIASRAIDYLATTQKDEPFFLWVDFVAPHPPADAPEPYHSMHPVSSVRLPHKTVTPIEGIPAARAKIDPETYQKFRAAYYGMISLLDAQVGRIVAALEKSGQLENTIIIFAGDQGSMLGDLGLWGKGVFYRGSINSPLVIAGPQELVKHNAVDRPVQLIDLAPTILGWAGASEDDLAHCRGLSLAPLLTGVGEFERRDAFAEDAETKMVVNDRYKFIDSPSGPKLFDLEKDPNETTNVADKRTGLVENMQRKLERWEATSGTRLPPSPKLLPNGRTKKKAAAEPPMNTDKL